MPGVGGGGEGGKQGSNNGMQPSKEKYSSMWKSLMDYFDDDATGDMRMLSMDYWMYLLIRFVVACVIIPSWILLGLLSAGWFWPPQVRKAMFVQSISSDDEGQGGGGGGGGGDAIGRGGRTSDSSARDVSEMRIDLRAARDQIRVDMEVGRKEVDEVRGRMGDHKGEVMGQMKEIKQIMTFLFELQSDV